MKVAIIKYNSGNVCSVQFALNRLGIEPVISDDAAEIINSDKVIFPGVGEASGAMAHLKKNKLDKVITSLRQPVLGICLGMQLMCEFSEEGNAKGLGIFNQKIKKMISPSLKVPHMGWNKIDHLNSGLFKNIAENTFMYFVHSYYAEKSENTIAQSKYINEFSCALQKSNFYGVQFHPEKSGKAGQLLIENFIKL